MYHICFTIINSTYFSIAFFYYLILLFLTLDSGGHKVSTEITCMFKKVP